ncbi:hypothetical protein A3A76_05470 [Candidatus Woesebacteria bacterium RIFCSPLOWO2_01_FULL_39_23]|uniref:Esterase n=1 Tax=Candidatus Woesebacteria bacterium RIFCSPHIGHO2_01_FULL_40_22 TaxID=1802499 RepID=A0A1F7YKM6_9BACT|nr:MAG: hypothetical protein A2141_03840 [Candidatus Woesebacteria bacterium RBG_16_40_11]OGM27904.1 MAG: hypothetical protein A2628_03395 [Candidatus Woesebacteria bacterium RIFCSPHIGHO2_01_FULL_40_22]OGM38141.1 MAG: hypothetical protein A3E41_00950 [Candidatus Woesebacteria bacterium RIFCSPHIGHO2_12_FULL_38_9]OGM61660.1 MAG: hypothetical protein A3A76_05470 [Candidatus Woesebacteria bacterium RIFCSPLOWO2_01_FULL_39_23]
MVVISGPKKFLLLFFLSIFLYGIFHWEVIFTGLQHSFYKLRNYGKNSSESKIDTFSFNSNSYAGLQKEAKVYLPKVYFEESDKQYPVLYLLHGFPGSDIDWLINADLQNKLDELVVSNKLPALIAVFPDGNGPIVKDSQYLNATTKINQLAEDYILELMEKIDASYRTLDKRESRAIGGISAGAYGAMNVGLHHNDKFGIIISHSGYFINNESITKKLINSDDFSANNPLEYLPNSELNPKTYIYFDIGEKDNKGYINQNQKLDEILRQKGIEHEFKITSGWHDWEVWRRNISFSLEFLGKYLEF